MYKLLYDNSIMFKYMYFMSTILRFLFFSQELINEKTKENQRLKRDLQIQKLRSKKPVDRANESSTESETLMTNGSKESETAEKISSEYFESDTTACMKNSQSSPNIHALSLEEERLERIHILPPMKPEVPDRTTKPLVLFCLTYSNILP